MVDFSSKVRGQLYQALKGSFPDAKVTDDDMLALAMCVKSEQDAGGAALPAALQAIDLTPYSSELSSKLAELPDERHYPIARRPGDNNRYYWVTATHARAAPGGFEPFTGELAMVRVTLAQRTPKTFHTAFGTVAPGDHLIDTVYEANQKYATHLGYELSRVDMITPARDVLRFGAISVLFGYKNKTDKKPSCYILEAGTATGQPKVLYLGKKVGEPINTYAGYAPTPFACAQHAYYGILTAQNDDDPDTLSISSREIENGVSQQPYIRVTIKWELQEGGLKNIWPGFLITRAATIVISRQLTGRIPKGCDDIPPPGQG